MLLNKTDEKSACGVGFLAHRKGQASHDILLQAIHALSCVEHRGACAADMQSGDGAGIMMDIPFEMFGYEKGSVAVATLFMPPDPQRLRLALKVFEETFEFMGLKVLEYRDVPTDVSVLGEDARRSLPAIKHAFIERPKYCRTAASFNRLLYEAKQRTRTKEKARGIVSQFFFTSLSTTTIVYKGLMRADVLPRFYLDLQNPDFKTRFALFHRRFSTNTRSSWDKAQPFRLISHNGEINTIASNRAWSYSREQSLGLPIDELLTHAGISDSGSLNEMVEALKYRSSIPHVEDILAIMMPPADQNNSFYKFWSRAMEPWDGPALITYSDGETIGARLDRNGFRPCRWCITDDYFYLCSEAGAFEVDEALVRNKGALHAGAGVTVELHDGSVHFEDPSLSPENFDAKFDPRLVKLNFSQRFEGPSYLHKRGLFCYSDEEYERVLSPMILEGKEGIGSMGDTARPAFLSTEPRSFFDYFYQDFAQVTNPPLDYLRENVVTDLVTHVGARPNIFAPTELVPPVVAVELSSPVLSLSQMAYFERLPSTPEASSRLTAVELDMTFRRDHGLVGFRSAIDNICELGVAAVEKGCHILILSDRHADQNHPPIPSLLVVGALVKALNRNGIRLDASIIVHSGEIRTTHHMAALIAFGATAVCPYLALEIARFDAYKAFANSDADIKEKNIIKAFEQGLLKVMSKMGISVVRSYQGSKLFTCLGLGAELIDEFFPGVKSPVGGIGMKQLVEDILKNSELGAALGDKLLTSYQFKEHTKGTQGERHSMTNARSRIMHEMLRQSDTSTTKQSYQKFVQAGELDAPVNLRHLLQLKPGEASVPLDQVEPTENILRRFGSGAMSFGAISAEAQRDIIIAMKRIGGRSNSGEGGENPYYYIDGTHASVKQVASARFGVTAEYLAAADGYQIKIAQGAKPGEGGQLMGVKVDAMIARARHSNTHIDLISPPPLHDIYSIEDLKELIYELKQFKPSAEVCVKLVSGANIGTIAIGVAKAGADVIHISGHDGGTGAAPLSSMKHAGLPWELGLAEVHQALQSNKLRKHVRLRVDGGLHTGKDILIATLLGSDEFEFGKLLLVAQGCVMARICEKNTCPTGIATHDPKFKAKYKGSPDRIAAVLQHIADEAREIMAALGARSLNELVGRTDLLEENAKFSEFVQARGLNLQPLLSAEIEGIGPRTPLFVDGISSLNSRIVADCREALQDRRAVHASYRIKTSDRAAMARLAGLIGEQRVEARLRMIESLNSSRDTHNMEISPVGQISLDFEGSAGQGFGVFLTSGIEVRLSGEANDSVCKSMSGGKVTIVPRANAGFEPAQNTIIGNCALYGATGGACYIYGLAGDRFAVRNSGATAVVEGTGLHACEYMTNGTVVILGKVSLNVGAGMTGGGIYMLAEYERLANSSYVQACELSTEDAAELRQIVSEYHTATKSVTAGKMLSEWDLQLIRFRKFLPKLEAQKRANNSQPIKTAAGG